jgi:hypothetical protein
MEFRNRMRTLSGVMALSILAASFAVHAQNTSALVIGESHEIESSILDETRTYFIAKPREYEFSERAYPIVILLDGETQFRHVSSTAELLADNDRIPEVIVVGVVNTDRLRDMSRPSPEYEDGGADKFLSFITDELIPEIEREYRTRPHRTLVGHSSAGLFGLFSLLQEPDAFDAYVLVSPAFGDDRSMLAEVRPFLEAHPQLQNNLFVSVANESGQLLGGAWELSGILAEAAPPGIRWQFHRWPDESHGSVPLRGVYEGLQASYGGWFLQNPIQAYDQGGIPAIERHYSDLSDRMKYTVSVPETVLTEIFNSLEVRLGGQADRSEAQPVIDKLLELYSESPAAHYYIGRFYAVNGDVPGGIDHLTQSLVLDPDYGPARFLLEFFEVDLSSIAPDVE